MKPAKSHRPGTPSTDNPPEDLSALADTLAAPQVQQVGITTTRDGRWALAVTVPGDCEVPLPAVERAAAGFPVVYTAASAPPLARPAYPALDE